ncbi:MAG: hypothetical protein J6V40_06130 [Clostridia bacterium]|nr:hypothetical protein [Clostridia bacterium]
MIVKDVIKLVANILGLTDVVSAIDSGYTSGMNIDEKSISADVVSEINMLVTSFNLVNNIIATNYLEILDSIEMESNGKIMYKDMCEGKVFLAVKNVTDDNNNKVSFTLEHDGIIVPKGKYVVTIAKFPEDKVLEDSILDYPMVISEKIFAYGVIAEYLLIKGDIDTASVYDLRFKQNLLDAIRPRHNIKLKERKFL